MDRGGTVARVVADGTTRRVDPSSVPGLADVNDDEIGASSCWSYTGWVQVTNVWGSVLWRYYQNIGWCISGTSVTHGWLNNRWAEVNWVGWSFEGHIGAGARTLSTSYRRYTQGHFQYGSGGWVIQKSYPCNQGRGYWNATAATFASCDLWM
jgi:hypothetical protein